MPRTRQHPTNAWDGAAVFEEDRLTENTAAPTIRHAARRRRAQLRLLKANVLLLPILLLLTTITVVGQADRTGTTARPASSTSVNSSPGKAAAAVAMQQWVTARPAPVPDATVLGWDGYTSKRIPATKTSAAAHIEIHHFTVASGAGDQATLYDSSVEVRISDDGIATVVGQPTLLPTINGASSSASSFDETWPGWTTASTPEPVTTAVTAWAKAFTSDDPDALRLAVGDKRKSHGYVPLTGAHASSVAVVAVAAKTPADGAADEELNTVIGRVTFDVNWSGKTSGNQKAASVTYDVLILDAASASPRVVAWGGPGDGPSLRPYQNAVRTALVPSAGATVQNPDDANDTEENQ